MVSPLKNILNTALLLNEVSEKNAKCETKFPKSLPHFTRNSPRNLCRFPGRSKSLTPKFHQIFCKRLALEGFGTGCEGLEAEADPCASLACKRRSASSCCVLRLDMSPIRSCNSRSVTETRSFCMASLRSSLALRSCSCGKVASTIANIAIDGGGVWGGKGPSEAFDAIGMSATSSRHLQQCTESMG